MCSDVVARRLASGRWTVVIDGVAKFFSSDTGAAGQREATAFTRGYRREEAAAAARRHGPNFPVLFVGEEDDYSEAEWDVLYAEQERAQEEAAHWAGLDPVLSLQEELQLAEEARGFDPFETELA